MKRILMLLVIMLPVCGNAQITLSESGYPASVLGADSLKITTAASLFPPLNAAAGGMWDLSAVTDSAPTFFAYRVHGMAGYQFADSGLYNVGGFAYQGNIQSNISASEINESHVAVNKGGYSLTFLTTGLHDSLIVDSQIVNYSTPRTKIAFPCSYNSFWSSSYYSDLGIHLTFLVNGDTSAPGYIRRYTTERDSVSGWGKMRVLDASGMPSDYLNVLQVQTRITHTDSFFLKGAPFSTFLLPILGVMQGQKDTIYEQNYYRGGELTPLAQVEFRDAGYTQPYKATTHAQRLSAVGVPGLVADKKLMVYPNPSSGGVLTIEMPLHGGSWSYKIVSTEGRFISEGILEQSGGKYNAHLPANTPPGEYTISVYGGGAVFSDVIEIR